MKLRILRGWRHYREDTVLDVPDGAAELLVRRGIAAAVDIRPASRKKAKEASGGPAPGDGPGR